ncbi:right-handed parallel beta-helix repeat-containing protein [Maribellus sp. YY47]|uniref:right-handed parallel beta-helix repeat-containing protein n=1 Tax=Maribellus sp. YY47 TaxID=2929486 RepID=UPI0020014059|nr:right-handed parallel beta-helix repeat-containing protein [Maribellus sp. YY47]MCK3684076.1 right-handed parallel beta-helix repeat-containing protein [Maribellus sp. YY47]
MNKQYSLKNWWLIAGIFMSISCTQNSNEFYVSPNGDDGNSGTANKPFRTVQKALDALPRDVEGNFTIHLTDGTYYLDEPLSILSSNFIHPEARVTVKAERHANPVISGGVQVRGWQKLENGLWEAKIETGKTPRELFVENKRCVRARFPNEGFLRVKKAGEDRRTNFFFEADEFPKPENLSDVELVLLHDWSISRIGIKEIDDQKHQLTAIDSVGAKSLAFFNIDGWEEHPRYFLENDRAFLDMDFEWYFDAETNKLLLKLPADQNPEDMEVFIPVSEGLLSINGSKDQPIKNISFDGITFRHSAWEIPELGYCGIQACHYDPRSAGQQWTVVPAAINAAWAENVVFQNCVFQNLGGAGLWFSVGCKDCSVENSLFSDIAGNGIMIGEGQDRRVNGKPWWQETPEDVSIGNAVKNCKVTQCGALFYGAVGIWCGLTAEVNVKDNHVYDLPYSGISIGWMWSPVPTPCRANVIDGNHIHDIMNVLSDGGGIYMLGLQPGSKLVNNHIHDVQLNAGRAESNGMFLDEGTTDVLVAHNLIYNISKSPLRFHRATTNLVKENYLFCTAGNPPIRYNNTNEEDIQKVDNVVLTEGEENYTLKLKEAKELFK